MTVFGREDMLFVISRAPLLSEVLAADILEHGEAERVEQKVPGLVLFLYETAGRQAESVTDGAGQQQNIQLWQRPVNLTAPQRRLWKENKKDHFKYRGKSYSIHTGSTTYSTYFHLAHPRVMASQFSVGQLDGWNYCLGDSH